MSRLYIHIRNLEETRALLNFLEHDSPHPWRWNSGHLPTQYGYDHGEEHYICTERREGRGYCLSYSTGASIGQNPVQSFSDFARENGINEAGRDAIQQLQKNRDRYKRQQLQRGGL